jgi:prepilin peptidase CpaA
MAGAAPGALPAPVEENQTVSGPLTIPTIVVLVAAVVATATDITRFRIHNALTLPLLVSGLIYHALMGGTADFMGSLLGACLGFGTLIAFYVMGGVGAGDVKFLAGIGAWLGIPLTFHVFIASSLAAGVYAVGLILTNQTGREIWIRFQILGHRLWAIGRHLGKDDCVETAVDAEDRRRRVIPFAAMVTVGLLALLLYTWIEGQLQSQP